MRFSRFEPVEKIGGKFRWEDAVGGSYEQALGRQATHLSSYSSQTWIKTTVLVSKLMSLLIQTLMRYNMCKESSFTQHNGS